MARAQGARAQMALGFESVYGISPGADDYWRMPFASSNLGAEQPLLSSELLGYGRDPLPPVKDAITADGDVVIPIDARFLGIWLKAIFGAPTTVASGNAAGWIEFAVNPSPSDTITLNGTTWTFVASGAASKETEIGLTLADTLAALVSDLNGSADTEVAKCTYSVVGANRLGVAFDSSGTGGNAFTLAASDATTSGATLTGGDGIKTHTFESGKWTLPSFSAEIGMPDVPYYALSKGCVANSISWTMNRSGLITATVNVIAQGETVSAASSAGSLTEMELLRFGSFNGAVKRNGVLLANITSAEVTYSNNLDRIETIRDDGMIDGADPSVAALTGTMNVRFADMTLVDQATSGDPCELEFSYAVDATRKFTLTAHAVYLPKAKIGLEGPAGVQISFAWQAAKDTSPARMCTAVLVNDVASYDNP